MLAAQHTVPTAVSYRRLQIRVIPSTSQNPQDCTELFAGCHCYCHRSVPSCSSGVTDNTTDNYVQREARSSSHCCSGKANIITYCECVFVALGAQYAMRMCNIVISGQPGSTILFHIISQTARFSEKKFIEHKMCVLIFSAQLLYETFLIVCGTELHMIKNF